MLLKHKITFRILCLLTILGVALAFWFGPRPVKYGIAPIAHTDGTTDYTVSERHNWVIRLPSGSFVESNWSAIEETVTICDRFNGCWNEKRFDKTNTWLFFQLDHYAKSQFQLSSKNDDRNPRVLVQFNESVVNDVRPNLLEQDELRTCVMSEMEVPGVKARSRLPRIEAEKSQKQYPIQRLEECRAVEELDSFILRDKIGELLGKGHCGTAPRKCDATIFTKPKQSFRILFEYDEFQYLQQHAEALVEFIKRVTVSGER
jgi:hypothetical protein